MLLFLLAAGAAEAEAGGQNPTPPAEGTPSAALIGQAATQPSAPNLPTTSNGIDPDPAASSVGIRNTPVQLPSAAPPANPSNSCDSTDCLASQTPPERKSPVHIGPPAQRALSESHDWAENPDAMPTRDPGGRVIFPFNQSAPTIVCAPLHVCDIELQAGEVVQGAPHVGDAVRWRISPAISGTDEKRVTHLIIKPTESGLDTNLIIPTDRHTYHLRLVSSTTRYVSSVGFFYPDDQQSWSDSAKSTKAKTNDGTDMPTVAVNRLNFDYKIKIVRGKPRFKPLRAMDDGYHTYISMSEDLPQQEAPVLVGISSSGDEQMINYRLKGNIYVIDGTVAKMAFIAGVGRDQQRVELTRDACKARGWLGICWDAKE
jgi:P-type conjugative transfer protein TrbG